MLTLNEPSTFWLTVTNVGLGILTVATALYILFEVLLDVLSSLRHRKVSGHR